MYEQMMPGQMPNSMQAPQQPQNSMYPSMINSQMGSAPSPFPLQNPTNPQYAAGGHVDRLRMRAQHIRGMGQRGDNILAYINPEEAMQLQQEHGMDINPMTGLPQFGLYDYLSQGANALYGAGKNFATSMYGDYGRPMINNALQGIDRSIQGALPAAGAAVGNYAGPLGGAAGGMAGNALSNRYQQSGGLSGYLMPKLDQYLGAPQPSANAGAPTMQNAMGAGLSRLQGGMQGFDKNVMQQLPQMGQSMGQQYGGDLGGQVGRMAGKGLSSAYNSMGGVAGNLMPKLNSALGYAHGGSVHGHNLMEALHHYHSMQMEPEWDAEHHAHHPEEYNDHSQIVGALRGKGQGGDDILAHINPKEAHELAHQSGYDINPETGLPQFGLMKKLLPLAGAATGFFFGGPMGATIGGAIGKGITGNKKDRLKNIGMGALMGGAGGLGAHALGVPGNFGMEGGLSKLGMGSLFGSQAPGGLPGSAAEGYSTLGGAGASGTTKGSEGIMGLLNSLVGGGGGMGTLLNAGLLGTAVGGTLKGKMIEPKEEPLTLEGVRALQGRRELPDIPKLHDPYKYADGGYIDGDSGGQDDDVDAKLSPGEYVWDATTVSLLGDGNNKAGALLLDKARKNIRNHKGLSKFLPPKSKSFDSYLSVRK